MEEPRISETPGSPTRRYTFKRCRVQTRNDRTFTIEPGIHYVSEGSSVHIGNNARWECTISPEDFKLLRAEGRAVLLD